MGLTAEEREIIRDELQSHGASYVAVFGSYARDEETEASDIDILVRFSERTTLLELARIERELGEQLGKQVELVTQRALSPYMTERIDAEKECLLSFRHG